MNLNDLRKKRKISREVELKVMKDTGFQLGRILEKARITKGRTQTELANEIGSTQSVIAKIENGSKLPSIPFLQRVADAFETYIIPPQFGFMVETQVVVKFVDWHLVGNDSFQAKSAVRGDVKTLINKNNYVTS